jgi:hypothetical protein
MLSPLLLTVIAVLVALVILVVYAVRPRKVITQFTSERFDVDDSMAAQELASSVPAFDAGALDRSMSNPDSRLDRLLIETGGDSQEMSF